MTEDFRLSAQNREQLGSLHTRRLREQGRVPANLYGFKKDAVNLSVCADEVEKMVANGSRVVDVDIDGSVEKAVIQELQWDIFSTHVRHVDLKRVNPESVVTVDVGLEIVGEPLGLKDGGEMKQSLKRVTVKGPDFRIPRVIRVRVGALQLGGEVKVSDLETPDAVEILTEANSLVVRVIDPKAAAAE
ncbi:MAG: 50S ribosomal protein L25 [Planctomycetaceae bacterium]|nr:50S ribosomal protein L25 [Planctomycetaceae bacterium]